MVFIFVHAHALILFLLKFPLHRVQVLVLISVKDDDKIGGRVVIAGCGDGKILVFDRRTPNRYSPLHVLNEHQKWVVNAHIPRSENMVSLLAFSIARMSASSPSSPTFSLAFYRSLSLSVCVCV